MQNSIISWSDKIIVFAFQALIFYLPISTAMVETFSTIIITMFFVKKTAVSIIGIRDSAPPASRLWTIPYFIKLLKGYKPERHYLNWPIGIFLCVNLLSVVFSQYPGLSLKGFIFKLFQSIALFYSFVECVKTKKQLQLFIALHLGVTLIIVVNGLIQYWRAYDFIYFHALQDDRVLSTFKHPNDLAAYLLVPLLLLMSMLSERTACFYRHKNPDSHSLYIPCSLPVQTGLWILLALSLICFGLTFSRGAWISFVLALFFMGILNTKTIKLSLLVATIFGVIFFPRMIMTRNASFLSDEVKSPQTIVAMRQEPAGISAASIWRDTLAAGKNFEAMGRKDFWMEAISIIKTFPVLGAGLNTYSRMAPQFSSTGGGYYAHNCYLQMTAETGILGLLSFGWVMLRFWGGVWRKVRIISDKFLAAVAIGFFSAWVGFMTHSFVDTNLYSVQLGNLMWLLMAVLVLTVKWELPKGGA